jgi:hypothetical protein
MSTGAATGVGPQMHEQGHSAIQHNWLHHSCDIDVADGSTPDTDASFVALQQRLFARSERAWPVTAGSVQRSRLTGFPLRTTS